MKTSQKVRRYCGLGLPLDNERTALVQKLSSAGVHIAFLRTGEMNVSLPEQRTSLCIDMTDSLLGELGLVIGLAAGASGYYGTGPGAVAVLLSWCVSHECSCPDSPIPEADTIAAVVKAAAQIRAWNGLSSSMMDPPIIQLNWRCRRELFGVEMPANMGKVCSFE